jgi:hypothetical protein
VEKSLIGHLEFQDISCIDTTSFICKLREVVACDSRLFYPTKVGFCFEDIQSYLLLDKKGIQTFLCASLTFSIIGAQKCEGNNNHVHEFSVSEGEQRMVVRLALRGRVFTNPSDWTSDISVRISLATILHNSSGSFRENRIVWEKLELDFAYVIYHICTKTQQRLKRPTFDRSAIISRSSAGGSLLLRQTSLFCMREGVWFVAFGLHSCMYAGSILGGHEPLIPNTDCTSQTCLGKVLGECLENLKCDQKASQGQFADDSHCCVPEVRYKEKLCTLETCGLRILAIGLATWFIQVHSNPRREGHNDCSRNEELNWVVTKESGHIGTELEEVERLEI